MKHYILLLLVGCLSFQNCGFVVSVPHFTKKLSDKKDFVMIYSNDENIKSSFLVPKNLKIKGTTGGVIRVIPELTTDSPYLPYEFLVTYKPIKQILGENYSSVEIIDSILKYYLKRYQSVSLPDYYEVIEHKKITLGGLPAREFALAHIDSENQRHESHTVIAVKKKKIYFLKAYYDDESAKEDVLEVFGILKASFKSL